MRRVIRLVSFCALLASCAGLDQSAGGSPEPLVTSTDNTFLVMLRQVPQHFRADQSYAGAYATRPEREATRRVAARLARDYDLAVLDDWPMPSLGVDCFVMQLRRPGKATELVEQFAHDERVESAQPVHYFRVLGQADSLYALQPAAQAWRLQEMHHIATGRGVRVAAIDTGVDVAHPDLVGRVSMQKNFVDESATPAEAHGTAVAGIIGARADAHEGTFGIAPGAVLLALRACWELEGERDARCSSFTLAKALQFAIAQGVQVVNLSLTGPRDRLLERLLDVAMAGRTTVVAAVDPRAHDGGFPASYPGVLAVDADVSSPGSPTALRAPGHDIPAPLPGGRWGLVSGPSFAAAEVTGVVAVLRELAPGLAPREARSVLEPPPHAGAAPPPIIDAFAAVERTADACACGATRGEPPSTMR
jgi:subtilisin family serine protease